MQVVYVNDFGIKPTNTFQSAGTDFYMPNVTDNTAEAKKALVAFEKSYKMTEDDIAVLYEMFSRLMFNRMDITNILHLYLALQSYDIEEVSMNKLDEDAVKYFINNYIVFDTNNTVGIKLRKDDTLFVNSGIKVGLGTDTCGLYVNKSGMGNKGFDVRACLVDEDYKGYVHLSMQYCKHTHDDPIIYCGDKLTQMMVFKIIHVQWNDIDDDLYNDYMKDSERGDAGFGSSDIKH